MSPEELAAIRARMTVPQPDGYGYGKWAEQASDDRAALLAEVDRLTGVLAQVRQDRELLSRLLKERQS